MLMITWHPGIIKEDESGPLAIGWAGPTTRSPTSTRGRLIDLEYKTEINTHPAIPDFVVTN
ncbi:hypothetical protein GCM10010320_81930 [Streptomyces caelestis]|nr:hypothetical protein GCM10010320_81930 [Streptomyces caelestis]